MKELSIKEKAKAYDEALERARIWQNNLYDTNDKDYADELNYIFPELKEEPEDERIRKALINVFATHKDYEIFFGVSVKDILAWLEKQSNPTDINPSEFDLRLNKLLKQFETLPKEELASSLNFYLNIVQNDGTYREEKQGEQNINVGISLQLDDQMSADNNESKFNIGDEIKTTNEEPLTITKIDDKGYWSGDLFVCSFEDSTKWELVGKFKPKFLNGQWIVWHGKCYTVYDNSCGYELLDQDGFITSLEYGTVEVNAHRWTIDDAKDGDVLADNIGVILFKSIRDNNVINYHAYLSGLFAVQKGEEYWGYAVNCKLSPATKEQRERFFAAMHDAGYEWDAEKKELKKIKNEIEIPFGAKDSELQEATYFIPQGFHAEIDDDKVVIKKGENTTTWGEEDECYMSECIGAIATKDGWSFEEKRKTKHWLKSLKNCITWKPSEEQIDAFEHFVRSIGESDYGFYYDNNTKLIYSLLEQLKQL